GGTRAIEAGEAVLDVGGVIGAALLAVVDDVEPAATCLATTSATARRTAALSSAALAPGLFCSCSMSSTTCGGRGRLPVCVVRMRSMLRFMGCYFSRAPRR